MLQAYRAGFAGSGWSFRGWAERLHPAVVGTGLEVSNAGRFVGVGGDRDPEGPMVGAPAGEGGADLYRERDVDEREVR
jgi:hypothetical protein